MRHYFINITEHVRKCATVIMIDDESLGTLLDDFKRELDFQGEVWFLETFIAQQIKR